MENIPQLAAPESGASARHGVCDVLTMSKIALPALYQTDTFGSSFRNRQFQQERKPAPAEAQASQGRAAYAPRTAPGRMPCFLIQLMASTDADLRKSLGRRDIAEHREQAYGAALSNRPSQRDETGTILAMTA